MKRSRACKYKCKGGLGIKDLRKHNSLSVKWWWKLDKKSGIWQEVVNAKYIRNTIVTSVKVRMNDSPCWKLL